MIAPCRDQGENYLRTLQKMYEERPGVFMAMMRVFESPPEVGELTIRFRDGQLAGMSKSESWF